MKFLRFQNIELQALVNAFASATRSQKADTAPLYQQATCASALPTTTLRLRWGPRKLPTHYYVHKAHPTAFSRYRCIRHRKPLRESLHLLTVFIVRQQDEYFYL